MLGQHGINSSWIFLTRVLTQALSVLFVAIVARRLGAEIFGQYMLLAAVVYIGNVFTTFGTDALLIREIAREGRVTQLASIVLWVQISLSLSWWLVVSLVGLLLTASAHLHLALVLYNLALFPLAFFSVISSTMRAVERLDLYLGLNLCSAVLQTLGAILLVRSSADLLLLCVWMVIVQVVTAVVGLFLCRAYIPTFSLTMNLTYSDLVNVIRSGWRLALFPPVGLFTQRLNLFVLSTLSGDAAAGFLSAAARLVDGLKLGHFALLNGLMPEMSRPETVLRRRILQSSLFGLLCWSFIPVILINLFADPIIRTIYGQAFIPSAGALRIIVWCLIPYTFSSYFSVVLSMRGVEALVLRANLICLVAAILVYSSLIPLLGLLGAAWGAFLVETLLAALLLMDDRSRSLLRAHVS